MSQKYDESRDSVRFYVDGAEKKAVQMVPDWANAKVIKHWGYSDDMSFGRHNAFTALSDGYIVVTDCYNNRDYYILVNNQVLPAAYHKCLGTNSSNGFFMIAKGDHLVLDWKNSNTSSNRNGKTDIYFIPGKITDD